MKAEVNHFLNASEEGYGMAYVHISGSLTNMELSIILCW